MANRRNVMGLVVRSDFVSQFSALGRPDAPVTPSVPRNAADDQVFAAMHRNKANFSIEKASAVFATLPRRKIG
jgi:hypothetical protein